MDYGGVVKDVIVDHPIYGELRTSLEISNRKDVIDFIEDLIESQAEPLSSLTDGVHIHTVEFENEEGQPIKENFRFSSVADFSVKNMTQNSPFLHKLDTEKTFYEGMVTQLRSNKVLQRVLENPESKKAFISALEALSNELKTE